MGKALPPIHIVITPLGTAIDIIAPPLDKWKPEVIYAFTSMPKSVKDVRDNLRFAWSKYCGPNGAPEVREITIEKPWLGETIEQVMEKFDAIIEHASKEFREREIKWHISITGGTNLLAIGMALSASTHLLPVYYTLPGDKHAELRSIPSQLVIDIPVFDQLGPAVNLLRKSKTKVELFSLINQLNSPISVESLAKKMDKTKTAIYAQVTPMIDCGMLVKQDKSTYTTTTLGKLAYRRWKGNSKS